MAIVNGVDYGQRVWLSSGHVDMRARPGRRTDLPAGVYASKLANGRETTSCQECKELLTCFASPAAALERGFQCGGPQGNELVDHCWKQARQMRRN
jgi:hypothetical protein